jgi:predicted DsbA family dithiol-disulfide isomerase
MENLKGVKTAFSRTSARRRGDADQGVPAFVAERLVMVSGVQPMNKLKELVDDAR